MRPLQLVMPIAIVRARMLVIPIYTNLDNQLFNGSVINTDVPNADVGRDNNVHNINAVEVTFPSPPGHSLQMFLLGDTFYFFLQETHSISEEGFSSWLDHATSSRSNKFGYKCISSSGTILSCGVAILCNRGYDVVSCSLDQEGRLLCQGW